MSNNLAQRLLWVLWPAFVVAAGAEFVFFALIDPADIHVFGAPIDLDRVPVYTIGFFFFWGIGAASAALTTLLQRSPFELNRCTLEPENRPVGCPKRT